MLGPSLTTFPDGSSVVVGGGSNDATVITADVAAGQRGFPHERAKFDVWDHSVRAANDDVHMSKKLASA